MAQRVKLSHVGRGGEARMVDVSAKPATERVAIAEGRRHHGSQKPSISFSKAMQRKAMCLAVPASPASWQPKRTHELIPLCHPLGDLERCGGLQAGPELPGVYVRATVR